MLILSRKKDERIVINDDIQIQVVDIRSDAVKLGIEAPKHIKIFRQEVWDTIQEENMQANIDVNKSKFLDSISHIHKQFAKKLPSKQQEEARPMDEQESPTGE